MKNGYRQKLKAKQTERVLCYSPKHASRSTVRRHYAAWREKQGIPLRCDMEDCIYYFEPLQWRGKPLPLILDHANGNNRDNSPENLRYLCPNCDSQLSTRGGANRGRVVEAGENRYVLLSRDGREDTHIITGSSSLQYFGYPPKPVVTKGDRDEMK